VVDLVKSGMKRQISLDLAALGRFAEPRLRRAVEQLTDQDERDYAQSYANAAHNQR
jgi:hypothetical protein